ncbi:MAG: hypothetical protein WC028_12440 [Candidatus Obscuribacterales bacterium]
MNSLASNQTLSTLDALKQATTLSQNAHQDYEHAIAMLSSSTRIQTNRCAEEIEKVLSDKDKLASLMRSRSEAVLTYAVSLVKARDANSRIREHRKALAAAITASFVELEGKHIKPDERRVLKASLLLAIAEDKREKKNYQLIPDNCFGLMDEIDRTLWQAFERLAPQPGWLYNEAVNKLSNWLKMPQCYPVEPAVSEQSIGYQNQQGEARRLEFVPYSPNNRESQFQSSPRLELELSLEPQENLRQLSLVGQQLEEALYTFRHFSYGPMQTSFGNLREENFAQNLLKLATGRLDESYSTSLLTEQYSRRRAMEITYCDFFERARHLEQLRAKLATILVKARDEVLSLLGKTEEKLQFKGRHFVSESDREAGQAGMINCLAADVLLRNSGATLLSQLEQFSSDPTKGKGMHIVDAELEQLRVSYKLLIEDHKRKQEKAEQTAKALALKVEAAKATEVAEVVEGTITEPTATKTGTVTVKISPPPGSPTNVY